MRESHHLCKGWKSVRGRERDTERKTHGLTILSKTSNESSTLMSHSLRALSARKLLSTASAAVNRLRMRSSRSRIVSASLC